MSGLCATAATIPELPLSLQQRAVFQKHHASYMYTTSSFAVAQHIVGIPLSIVQTLLFGIVMWWMTGLNSDGIGGGGSGGRFGLFLIVALFLSLSVNQWMRVIASASQNLQVL